MPVSEKRSIGNVPDQRAQRCEDSLRTNSPSSQNLKSGRSRCYTARDAYYACVDASKSEGGARDTGRVCGEYRAAFEASCAKSWVQHFDSLREKEARVYRRIQDGIIASEKREGTLGGLQGQREDI